MEVIKCDRSDERFVQLKNRIYGDFSFPPMPEPHHENLLQCFLVLDDRNSIARAALFGNRKMMLDEKTMAQVGSFEAFNNEAATMMLFEAIGNYARKAGFDALVGPMNGSTWHPYRFNCKEEKLFFTEHKHPAYYLQLWEKTGFSKLSGYYSSISRNIAKSELPEVKEIPGIKIRTMNLDNYEGELTKIYEFCSAAFSANFLFTSISAEAFVRIYLPVKQLLDARMVLMAEDKGRLVGLMLCLPDLYSPAGKRAIIKTLVRSPEKQYSGLGHLLSRKLYVIAQQLGYEDLIHAFIRDDGSATEVSGNFFGESYHQYLLYKKEL